MSEHKHSQRITRRDFVRTTAVAGAGAAVLANGRLGWASRGSRKRYAIVGVGGRSQMYQNAIHTTFGDSSELVACCDVNEGRLHLARDLAEAAKRPAPTLYAATDFDRMLKESHPDVVIVTTVDGFHHEYLCRAMGQGYDVITEKPMTVDAEKCQQIVDAQRKCGPGLSLRQRQARVLHAQDGRAARPARPARALPHLPGEGPVRL